MKRFPSEATTPVGATTHPASPRVLAIDALRGFDMFWIIGGEYVFKALDRAVGSPATNWIAAQLDHSPWYGFTFYDIIMPLFMFLVGVSMVYSTSKRLAADPSHRRLWKHNLIRVAILWVLGMMVQGHLLSYDIEQIAFYSNTLQAIAAGYLIASLITLYLPRMWQAAATAGLMLLYWAVFAFVPGPGATYDSDGNIALHIDKMVLGSFQDGTTYTWILSSLNFGATTMLGAFTAYILRAGWRPTRTLITLTLTGTGLLLLSLAWMPLHPMVKHLWTGPFVLFSGGICMLMLSLFYLLTDVLGYRAWTAGLVVIGSNAIFAYVTSHLFDYSLIAQVFLNGLERYSGAWQWFILSLGGFAVLYTVLYSMHRKKIFIKI
jgi:predicted acyltransferase